MLRDHKSGMLSKPRWLRIINIWSDVKAVVAWCSYDFICFVFAYSKRFIAKFRKQFWNKYFTLLSKSEMTPVFYVVPYTNARFTMLKIKYIISDILNSNFWLKIEWIIVYRAELCSLFRN